MIQRFCHWYICRIDYGRANVWAPMHWLYRKCDAYVNPGVDHEMEPG